MKRVYAVLLVFLSLFLDVQAAELFKQSPLEHASHWIMINSTYGENITLSGGTIWQVSPEDVYKTAHFTSWVQRKNNYEENDQWIDPDYAIIFPGVPSSAYKYVMTNTATGDHLEVNLIPPSHEEYVNAFFPLKGCFITDLVYPGKYEWNRWQSLNIYLNNCTCWTVNEADRDLFLEWKVKDSIFIGLNNDSSSSDLFPNILINVNLNNYIRVRCYSP